MKNEVRKIKFDGGDLLGIKSEDGRIYLAIRKACLDIGLKESQADAEVKKVKNSLLFVDGWLDLNVKFDVQVRNTALLEEKFVPIWLAQINLTPNMRKTNPAAVDKLMIFQLKAATALHEAFMATEEQKQELYNELGLRGQIIELEQTIADMKVSLDRLVDSYTINSRQAQKILHAGKDRINYLLGGARSDEYKRHARVYFKNMWNQFAEAFGVTTYKDLSPINMNDGYSFINKWNYVES